MDKEFKKEEKMRELAAKIMYFFVLLWHSPWKKGCL